MRETIRNCGLMTLSNGLFKTQYTSISLDSLYELHLGCLLVEGRECSPTYKMREVKCDPFVPLQREDETNQYAYILFAEMVAK